MVDFPTLDSSRTPHAAQADGGRSSVGAVAIFGLGVSGLAAARWALANAPQRVARVALVDGSCGEALHEQVRALCTGAPVPVDIYLGETARLEGRFDIGVISPGIAPGSELWNLAYDRCAEVVSEVELAFRESSHRWVAITGTNGKTTTTSLVTHLLNHAGVDAVSVGNIGYSALEAALSVHPDTVLVAEVSSFQLATSSRFHPEAAAIVNITPDHLNWHVTMERYAADKAKVFANLSVGDLALYFGDDEFSAEQAARVSASAHCWRVSLNPEEFAPVLTWWGSPSNPTLGVRGTDGTERWCDAGDLAIKGAHNWSNVLFAGAIARYWGIDPAVIEEGLRSFAPVEHRLEYVGSVAGVEYYNDSKATNPDATMKAVDSFPGKRVHLLVGGRPKGSDFHELASYARGKAHAAICFGEAQAELNQAFLDEWPDNQDSVYREPSMIAALHAASSMATEGDIVLLSPACASFDEFSGYEERGRVFAAAVADLLREATTDGP